MTKRIETAEQYKSTVYFAYDNTCHNNCYDPTCRPGSLPGDKGIKAKDMLKRSYKLLGALGIGNSLTFSLSMIYEISKYDIKTYLLVNKKKFSNSKYCTVLWQDFDGEWKVADPVEEVLNRGDSRYTPSNYMDIPLEKFAEHVEVLGYFDLEDEETAQKEFYSEEFNNKMKKLSSIINY